MAEPRRRRLLAGLALAALAATGCAQVPDSGPVQTGRNLPALDQLQEPDIQFVPPKPVPGEKPQSVVIGFLQACATPIDDYAAARAFLTPAAASSWQPDRATIYDSSEQPVSQLKDGGVVLVTAPLVGSIEPDGSYRVREGKLDDQVHMQKVDGQWRISDPPGDILLASAYLDQLYIPVDLYFLAEGGHRLVPDHVFLQSTRHGLATALVTRLLAGPTSWLKPSVSTAIPANTTLVGNVPIENGVARVQLSTDVLGAGPDARRQLAAQIVYTLRQLPDVTQVEILVGGTPLNVPGAGSRQARDSWPGFAPDDPGRQLPYYYVTGHKLVMDGGAAVPGPWGAGSLHLQRAAVAADRRHVAGVVTTSGGQQALVVGTLTGHPRQVLTGDRITNPDWDGQGHAWVVVHDQQGQHLVTVSGSGQVQPVDAGGLFKLGIVTSLAVDPTVTRLAVVIDGTGGPRLQMARIVENDSALSVQAPFPVLRSGYQHPTALSWAGAGLLSLLAVSPTFGAVTPVQISTDGSKLTEVSTDITGTTLTGLAAAAGQSLLVATKDHAIYSNASGSWVSVAKGMDPTYPG